MAIFDDDQRRQALLLGVVPLLFLVPQALGGEHPRARVLSLAGCSALALLARRHLTTQCCGLFGWAALLACGWSILQLVPLPAGIVGFLAPASTALRSEVLGDSHAAGWQTISLAPGLGSVALERCAAALLLLYVAASIRGGVRAARTVVLTLTILGGYEVAYALATSYGARNPQVYGWANPYANQPLRLAGTFIAPSAFAGLLAVLAPLALALGLSLRISPPCGQQLGLRIVRLLDQRVTWYRLACLACCGAMLVGIALAQSPPAWLAAGAGFLTYLVLEIWRKPRALVTAMVLIVTVLVAVHFVPTLALCLSGVAPPEAAMSAGWPAAWNLVGEHFLSGAGLGAFPTLLGRIQPAVTSGYPILGIGCDLIERIGELGIVTTAALLASGMMLLYSAVGSLTPRHKPERRKLLHGLVAAGVAILVRLTTAGDMQHAAILLVWASIFGTLHSLLRDHSPRPSHRGLSLLIPLVVFAIIAALLRQSPPTARLLANDQSAFELAREHVWQVDRVTQLLAGAEEVHPGLHARLAQLDGAARYSALHNLLTQQIAVLRAAVQAEPGEGRYHARLALRLAQLGGEALDPTLASEIERHAAAAERLIPHDLRWQVEAQLAQIRSPRRHDAAVVCLRSMLASQPVLAERATLLAFPLGLEHELSELLPPHGAAWRQLAISALLLARSSTQHAKLAITALEHYRPVRAAESLPNPNPNFKLHLVVRHAGRSGSVIAAIRAGTEILEYIAVDATPRTLVIAVGPLAIDAIEIQPAELLIGATPRSGWPIEVLDKRIE
jgi:hypothetical protein